MAVSKKDIEHIAKLARLGLTEKERGKYSRELSGILNYIDKLNEVETENIEPTSQVTGLASVFRKDENPHPVDPEKIKSIISQAPEREGNFIKTKTLNPFTYRYCSFFWVDSLRSVLYCFLQQYVSCSCLNCLLLITLKRPTKFLQSRYNNAFPSYWQHFLYFYGMLMQVIMEAIIKAKCLLPGSSRYGIPVIRESEKYFKNYMKT